MGSSTSRIRRTDLPAAVVGALALLGAAVLVGSLHSWITPVVLRPDWSKNKGPGASTSPQPGHAGSSASAKADAADDQAAPDLAISEQVESSDTRIGSTDEMGHYIDLSTARQLFDEGALFIDARPREEYDRSHVAGAVYLTSELISSGKARETLDGLVQDYGFDYPIVIYCHGGDCDASDNVAKLLLPMGFHNLRVMKVGFDDWKAAGYEVE
ncbi:MAG: hypothetical protein Kow0022_06800 [Phycisphaerales bacterium]